MLKSWLAALWHRPAAVLLLAHCALMFVFECCSLDAPISKCSRRDQYFVFFCIGRHKLTLCNVSCFCISWSEFFVLN